MSKLRSLTFFTLLLFLTGCSEKTMEVITDPTTKIDIESISTITSDMIVIHSMQDEMDRGNHDFFDKDVVVEPNYYEKNPINRGNIITYNRDKNDDVDGMTRVIALEGEEVKISTGQFYINGEKLDTFYGRGHRLGRDLNELENKLEQGDFEDSHIEQNVKSAFEFIKNINEEEITVPEGYVYVAGDDWFRSGIRGILPKENITGKVLGYEIP